MARYVAGCSCLECCNAWSEYQRGRKLDPTPRRVDADPVRAHIAYLKEAGMGRPAIAHAAGISYGILRLIEAGQREVMRSTAEVVLAVVPNRPARVPYHIGAAPTIALIEQARSRGVSMSLLARESGRPRQSFPRAGQGQIESHHALAILEACERLGVVRGGPVVEVDTDELKRVREHVFSDQALERAYWRAVREGRTSLATATRLEMELGVDLCAS